MKPYRTLYYVMKNSNIGLLMDIMREVCIIFWAFVVLKLKYKTVILKQVYIIDTKAINSISW